MFGRVTLDDIVNRLQSDYKMRAEEAKALAMKRRSIIERGMQEKRTTGLIASRVWRANLVRA